MVTVTRTLSLSIYILARPKPQSDARLYYMLRGSSGVWNVISPQVNLDKPDKYIVKSTVELSPDVPN